MNINLFCLVHQLSSLRVLFISVFLPFFVLELGITPYQRGFFCNDNSIHYPYKDDTVTTLVITLVGLLVPIAVVRKYQMNVLLV